MVYSHCQCNMIPFLTYGVNSTSNISILTQWLDLFRRFPLLCLHSTKQWPCIFIIDRAHIIFCDNEFPKLAIGVGVKLGLHRGSRTHLLGLTNTLNLHLKCLWHHRSLHSFPLILPFWPMWEIKILSWLWDYPCLIFLLEGPWQPWTVGALLANSAQGPYSGGSHAYIRFSSYTWNHFSDNGAKVLRQKTDFLSSKRWVDVKNAPVSFPASRRNARHTNTARE